VRQFFTLPTLVAYRTSALFVPRRFQGCGSYPDCATAAGPVHAGRSMPKTCSSSTPDRTRRSFLSVNIDGPPAGDGALHII
jgi:hypothetical protein